MVHLKGTLRPPRQPIAPFVRGRSRALDSGGAYVVQFHVQLLQGIAGFAQIVAVRPYSGNFHAHRTKYRLTDWQKCLRILGDSVKLPISSDVHGGVRQNSSGAINCRAGALAWILDSSFPSVLSLRPGIRGRELFTEGNERNEDLA